MARTRQIKPEFFLDDELAQCSAYARLLFAGLWTLADRAGRLENRPAKIKAQVFPYDNDIDPVKVGELLAQLEEHRFIYIYEVDGRSYIQIRTFEKHQHCHVNEPPSQLPERPECKPSRKVRCKHGASTVQVPYKDGASTGAAPEEHGANPSAYTCTSTDTSNTACTSNPASTGTPASTDKSTFASGSGHAAGDPDAERPKHTGKPRRASQRTGCPDVFEPSERLKEWASKSFPQLRLEEETEKFLDHHRAKGNSFADWDAAWRTWIRNAVRWREPSTRNELPPMAERLATDEDKRNYSPHGY